MNSDTAVRLNVLLRKGNENIPKEKRTKKQGDTKWKAFKMYMSANDASTLF